eukprot:1157990-Pelagomonas_calceolata.AAC.5
MPGSYQIMQISMRNDPNSDQTCRQMGIGTEVIGGQSAGVVKANVISMNSTYSMSAYICCYLAVRLSGQRWHQLRGNTP